MLLEFKVDCIGRCDDIWINIIMSQKEENKKYLLVTLDQVNDCFEKWVVQYISQIIMYMKHIYSENQQDKAKLVIVVIGEERKLLMEQAAQEAFWNAVRGIVHTVVLEEGAKKCCLNAVYTEKGYEQSFGDIVKYLSEGTGDFCVGSTFDLRCWI